MDKIERSAKIHGKNVRVILIFDAYKERHFKKDFQRYVDYQQKKSLTGEVGETFLKFYRQIKEFTPIPFNVFREYNAHFFSQVIFKILEHNPEFIVSDELNVQVRLIYTEGDYFESKEEASDPENACYDGAGSLFLHMIVAPYYYLRHVDFTAFYKYFLHELEHFFENMEKYTAWETRYEKKIKLLAKKRSAYCLNYLYNSMFNLKEEGIADFMARGRSDRIDIKMDGVREYNKNLEKLVVLRTKKQSEKFYEKRIGWDNLTPSGEYANGRIMCLFVALAVAKRIRVPYTLIEGKQKLYGYEFKDLDKILMRHGSVYISNLPEKAFREAVSLIRPRPHYYFLKLYERACNELGISDRNRVMTSRRFHILKNKAIDNAREEKRRRLRRSGFEVNEGKIE